MASNSRKRAGKVSNLIRTDQVKIRTVKLLNRTNGIQQREVSKPDQGAQDNADSRDKVSNPIPNSNLPALISKTNPNKISKTASKMHSRVKAAVDSNKVSRKPASKARAKAKAKVKVRANSQRNNNSNNNKAKGKGSSVRMRAGGEASKPSWLKGLANSKENAKGMPRPTAVTFLKDQASLVPNVAGRSLAETLEIGPTASAMLRKCWINRS
jgi:hypothetical protein